MGRTVASRGSGTAGRSPAGAGIMLGMGMGGFVDGIVLHQILQWHQMLSTTARYGQRTLANMQVNVMADGFFHVATWIFVAIGLALQWRATSGGRRHRGVRSLVGWILVGWGLFNLVEGVVDHHLLGIHRVRPDAAAPLAWDIGFLVLGALLVVAGLVLQRDGRREAREATRYRSPYG